MLDPTKCRATMHHPRYLNVCHLVEEESSRTAFLWTFGFADEAE